MSNELRKRYFVGPVKPSPEEVLQSLREELRRWCPQVGGCCCVGCANRAFNEYGYGEAEFQAATLTGRSPEARKTVL